MSMTYHIRDGLGIKLAPGKQKIRPKFIQAVQIVTRPRRGIVPTVLPINIVYLYFNGKYLSIHYPKNLLNLPHK